MPPGQPHDGSNGSGNRADKDIPTDAGVSEPAGEEAIPRNEGVRPAPSYERLQRDVVEGRVTAAAAAETILAAFASGSP